LYKLNTWIINSLVFNDSLAIAPLAIRYVVEFLCAQYAHVFGSVLSGVAAGYSVLDILIDPTPDTSLMDLAVIQVLLEKSLGMPVDMFMSRFAGKFCSIVPSYPMPVRPIQRAFPDSK
jgi:uncharacterized protein